MKINLIEYFEETYKEKANKIAVIQGDKEVTFQELAVCAKSIAQQLIELSKDFNKPVAVYLPKSIDTVVADLGITYSGNIYMNLDVKTPVERTFNILKTIEPLAIITTSTLFSKLESDFPSGIDILVIDKLEHTKYEDKVLQSRLSNLIDTDPYCIINTSGSTGTPKGVVLNHKSFIDFTEWATETLKFGKDEIIGSLSPSVFDIYSHELCMLMSLGSTMVLLPDNLSAFPYKILEILKERKVTYLFWVPTIMVNIANMDLLSKIELPDLKIVWFAGEVFPTKQFNYWNSKLNNTMFVNLYGPIEITLDCTYYIVNRKFNDDEPLPIGIPCRNTSILILNEKNQLCKVDEEGELCVRGTSLAMGYYNNPEKTAAAFTQNPLNTKYPETIYRTGDVALWGKDGNIYFKGRRDTLIKHLGYRIELAEIEHIIVNTLKLVTNGCVVYNKNDKEIILFYENTTEITAAEFRKSIGSSLPKYMIPVKYIYLEKMPMNTNGKIDRLYLNNQINNG